jgi:hypothetical protein
LATQPMTLDYGDPMDISPTTFTPNQGQPVFTSPVVPMPSKPIRRTSLVAAKKAAAANDVSREEGEISDEDTRTKQKAGRRVKAPVLDTQSNSDMHTLPSRPSPQKAFPNRTTQTLRRDSTAGGMPPPPIPSASVHREPAPISPSATIPNVVPVRSSTVPSPTTNGTSTTARRSSTPTPQTHSFDKFRMDAYTDDEEESLSPKTEELNRDFFTKLLQQGIDDTHCRPGLPSESYVPC